MNSGVFTLLSSGLALMGVALGAWLGSRNSGSQWLRDTQFKVCTELMEQYASLYAGLAQSRRGDVPELTWSSWNHALDAVSFVCSKAVVDAAYNLDETFWRADWQIRGGRTGQENWTDIRRAIDAAHRTLVHAVRRQSSTTFREEVRVQGRPSDDDPMWAPKP